MAGLLDTQNQHWASDKSAFGFRMLQKMGWKEGKGLGLKEDGTTEHIRVKRPVSTAGVGMKKNSAWEVPGAVATGFNDVLKGLQTVGADVQVGGEESVSGGRGFYERRAVGKNVRGYSKKDLKEIFGGVEETGRENAMVMKDEHVGSSKSKEDGKTERKKKKKMRGPENDEKKVRADQRSEEEKGEEEQKVFTENTVEETETESKKKRKKEKKGRKEKEGKLGVKERIEKKRKGKKKERQK